MSEVSTPVVARSAHATFIKESLRQYGLLLSLIVIMIFFQIATHGTLLRPLNMTNLVLQNSYIAVMALGMLLVIVTGHIDLSVGSVSGFVGALAAVMLVEWNWPVVPTGLLCLLAGALVGAIQGAFVAYIKIPSFIVTLAGMLVFRGLLLALLQGQSVGPLPAEFQLLSSGFFPELIATIPRSVAPDLLDGNLRVASLLLGVLVALFLFWSNVRTRARQRHHGLEVEPMACSCSRTC